MVSEYPVPPLEKMKQKTGNKGCLNDALDPQYHNSDEASSRNRKQKKNQKFSKNGQKLSSHEHMAQSKRKITEQTKEGSALSLEESIIALSLEKTHNTLTTENTQNSKQRDTAVILEPIVPPINLKSISKSTCTTPDVQRRYKTFKQEEDEVMDQFLNEIRELSNNSQNYHHYSKFSKQNITNEQLDKFWREKLGIEIDLSSELLKRKRWLSILTYRANNQKSIGNAKREAEIARKNEDQSPYTTSSSSSPLSDSTDDELIDSDAQYVKEEKRHGGTKKSRKEGKRNDFARDLKDFEEKMSKMMKEIKLPAILKNSPLQVGKQDHKNTKKGVEHRSEGVYGHGHHNLPIIHRNKQYIARLSALSGDPLQQIVNKLGRAIGKHKGLVKVLEKEVEEQFGAGVRPAAFIASPSSRNNTPGKNDSSDSSVTWEEQQELLKRKREVTKEIIQRNKENIKKFYPEQKLDDILKRLTNHERGGCEVRNRNICIMQMREQVKREKIEEKEAKYHRLIQNGGVTPRERHQFFFSQEKQKIWTVLACIAKKMSRWNDAIVSHRLCKVQAFYQQHPNNRRTSSIKNGTDDISVLQSPKKRVQIIENPTDFSIITGSSHESNSNSPHEHQCEQEAYEKDLNVSYGNISPIPQSLTKSRKSSISNHYNGTQCQVPPKEPDEILKEVITFDDDNILKLYIEHYCTHQFPVHPLYYNHFGVSSKSTSEQYENGQFLDGDIQELIHKILVNTMSSPFPPEVLSVIHGMYEIISQIEDKGKIENLLQDSYQQNEGSMLTDETDTHGDIDFKGKGESNRDNLKRSIILSKIISQNFISQSKIMFKAHMKEICQEIRRRNLESFYINRHVAKWVWSIQRKRVSAKIIRTSLRYQSGLMLFLKAIQRYKNRVIRCQRFVRNYIHCKRARELLFCLQFRSFEHTIIDFLKKIFCRYRKSENRGKNKKNSVSKRNMWYSSIENNSASGNTEEAFGVTNDDRSQISTRVFEEWENDRKLVNKEDGADQAIKWMKKFFTDIWNAMESIELENILPVPDEELCQISRDIVSQKRKEYMKAFMERQKARSSNPMGLPSKPNSAQSSRSRRKSTASFLSSMGTEQYFIALMKGEELRNFVFEILFQFWTARGNHTS